MFGNTVGEHGIRLHIPKVDHPKIGRLGLTQEISNFCEEAHIGSKI